ncbi:MAG: hypothetical protein BGO67_03735 [Alphaproteobacteria bacterium 41-28]|nr:MAG: hypothetical protein BGO67_03735 [Alphaproteobacteria bacterium 41-28]
MTQPNKSSTEAQYKIAHFLQEEAERLKSEYQEDLQRRNMKQKKYDKKRIKLSQKIGSVLKLHSLEADIKEELLSLQQQLKDFL